MDGFNQVLTRSFEAVVSPMYAWPLLTLLLLAIVSGILMSLVFKYVSNQQALATVLDRGRGNALAIKLFKDDMRGMFYSLANVLGLMLKRIWYSLSPVLVLSIPLFFLLSQIYLRYENRPLEIEEPTVFELRLNETSWESANDVALTTSENVLIETPALRDELDRSIAWRISAKTAGVHTIKVNFADAEVEKSLIACSTGQLQQVSEVRPGTNWAERLWFAGETSVDSVHGIESLSVNYPKRRLPIFGYPLPWWLTYFIVSILAALLSQPLVKVRF